jgi:hypothetical protein
MTFIAGGIAGGLAGVKLSVLLAERRGVLARGFAVVVACVAVFVVYRSAHGVLSA